MGKVSETMDYGVPPWEDNEEVRRVPPARVRTPQTGGDIAEAYTPPPPKLKLTQRRKRGPKKKTLTAAERELRLMTPRMRDLAEGRLKVEDLDWEELTRGQLRDKNGKFSGTRPAILPRAWHDAVAAEIVRGAEAEFRRNFDGAMATMVQMATNPGTPARERLAAAQYVIERTIGPIVQKTENKTEIAVFDAAVANGEFLVDLGESDALEASYGGETEDNGS